MTLVNDCTCTTTGECLCTKVLHQTIGGVVYQCECECGCMSCEIEYVAEACACGGNCGCSG